MATQRLPLLRTEISGNFDSGESSQIMSVRYDPNQSGDTRMRPGINMEDLVSSFPIVIYDYKFEWVTNTITQGYQWYCDKEEITVGDNWNPSSTGFLEALKQHKLTAGTQFESTSDSIYQKGTLRFKARKYYSRKHRQWKWAIPPIVLSKNKKSAMGFSLANVTTGSNNRTFYATVTVKNWSQML